MEVHIRVLGSSSRGNATLIWSGEEIYLVDCGFPRKYLFEQLRSLHIDPAAISGLLITHSHRDHLNEPFLKFLLDNEIPIFASPGLIKRLPPHFPSLKDSYEYGILERIDGKAIQRNNVTIKRFDVPHDAAGGCSGYNLYFNGSGKSIKITAATDIAYPTDSIIESFLDSDAVIIESNHDPHLLENSGRHPVLIERILKSGHLSNDQCASMLEAICLRSGKLPAAIVLAHISQQCNTNEIAVRTTQSMLGRNQLNGIKIIETFERRPNKIVTLRTD
jgi:phosphoribosyl 1,2-cyclic phosphodiesterase